MLSVERADPRSPTDLSSIKPHPGNPPGQGAISTDHEDTRRIAHISLRARTASTSPITHRQSTTAPEGNALPNSASASVPFVSSTRCPCIEIPLGSPSPSSAPHGLKPSAGELPSSSSTRLKRHSGSPSLPSIPSSPTQRSMSYMPQTGGSRSPTATSTEGRSAAGDCTPLSPAVSSLSQHVLVPMGEKEQKASGICRQEKRRIVAEIFRKDYNAHGYKCMSVARVVAEIVSASQSELREDRLSLQKYVGLVRYVGEESSQFRVPPR